MVGPRLVPPDSSKWCGSPVTGPPSPPVQLKLLPPRRQPGIIDRPRLIGLLRRKPETPVVTVFAPPGYGKTTLASEWMTRSRRSVAWLTLDDQDNDPAVLLSDLAAALATVGSVPDSLWPTLTAPRGRMLAAALPRLLSGLALWERPALLILDDVHRIVDTTALDVLAGLANHWPRGFRIVLTGRAAPDLPLARFRAHRELLEIGPDQLALDEREVGALMDALGHHCSPEEIRGLTDRTEGWAAAVYLASLAHERHPGTTAAVEIAVSGKRPLHHRVHPVRAHRRSGDGGRGAAHQDLRPGAGDTVTGRGGGPDARGRTQAGLAGAKEPADPDR